MQSSIAGIRVTRQGCGARDILTSGRTSGGDDDDDSRGHDDGSTGGRADVRRARRQRLTSREHEWEVSARISGEAEREKRRREDGARRR